jgi:NAD-specific glutamate dehydrogenase
LAESLTALRFLDQLLEILRIAREAGADPSATASAYYRVSDSLRVSWLRRAIFDAAGDDRWERRSAQALADDLTRAHHRLVVRVMAAGDGEPRPDEIVRADADLMGRFRDLLEEIEAEPALDLPALSVAVRELNVLCERVDDRGAPGGP